VCGWGTETEPASEVGAYSILSGWPCKGPKRFQSPRQPYSPVRSNPLSFSVSGKSNKRGISQECRIYGNRYCIWRERGREGEKTCDNHYFQPFSLRSYLYRRFPSSAYFCCFSCACQFHRELALPCLAQAAQTCLAERPPNLVPSSFFPSHHTPLSSAL